MVSMLGNFSIEARIGVIQNDIFDGSICNCLEIVKLLMNLTSGGSFLHLHAECQEAYAELLGVLST